MTAELKNQLEAAFRDILTRMPPQFTTLEAVQALRSAEPSTAAKKQPVTKKEEV